MHPTYLTYISFKNTIQSYKGYDFYKVNIIVRIEFSPVVEISASKGQNLLQETTYVVLALSHVFSLLLLLLLLIFYSLSLQLEAVMNEIDS